MSSEQDIAQQIAKLRAEREALASKRAELAKLQALRDELASEAQALEDEKTLGTLIEAHGPLDKALRVVKTGHGIVVVKCPHHLTYRKFSDEEKPTTKHCEALIRPCLVHPDWATFQGIVEKEPAVVQRAAGACCILAGTARGDDEGK